MIMDRLLFTYMFSFLYPCQDFYRFLVSPCCSSFYFFVFSYYVYLCSEFRVVMSVTISSCKNSIRLYLQSFVGGCMSYLRYLFLLAMSNTYCAVFLFCFPSSGVTYAASFSGLSFFDCPIGIN
jgi:hypothetical protein